MGMVNWLKKIEERGDAWAAKRLTPDEFAEAVHIDRLLKKHFGRLVLGYIALTALVTVLFIGLKPSLPLGEAFVIANILVVSFGFGGIGVWFGYRRNAKKPLWLVGLIVLAITAAGALFGAMVGKYSNGITLRDIAWEDFLRMLSVGVLTGLIVAFFVVGTTWIRNREERARLAALRAEAERERFAKRTTEAELKLLQAQVEPHFLFNTLANLRFLVQSNSKDALPMLDHLIDYLRTALPEIRAQASTVGREAKLARAYLEIMRLRMGGALEVAIDVPDGLDAHAFPPLMLLTLVENAVKHGVAPAGRGHIGIRAYGAGDLLRVEVSDDGRGFGGTLGQGVGLTNVRERLAALYGDRARLLLESGATSGAVATIEVPGT